MNLTRVTITALLNKGLKENPYTYKMSLSDTSDVISNLKFIGLIEKHCKINVSNLSLQPIGPMTKFNRRY